MSLSAEIPENDDRRQIRQDFETQRVFYQTMSEAISPLIDKLSQINCLVDPNQVQHQRIYTAESMQVIKEYLKDLNLIELEIDLDSLLFMHKDQLGYMIRRPVLNSLIISALNSFEAKSTREALVQGAIEELYVDNAYHYFEGGPDGFTYDKFRELVNDQPEIALRYFGKLHEMFREKGIQYNSEKLHAIEESENSKGWVTDAGHGLSMFDFGKVVYLVSADYNRTEQQLDISIGMIEDDPWCFWIDAFYGLANNSHSYTNVSEAISDLLSSKKLPDVIVCDIELGLEVSGLEIAKQIKEHAQKTNQAPIIYLYSYAYLKYAVEAESLMQRGIVHGFLDKKNLDMKGFVENVKVLLGK